MAGYTGKVVFVDLTSGSIEEEILPEAIYRDFIGGIGLGVRILYERMRPNVDPLGTENMLGFVTGLLTGAPAPMASKFMVVTKSPLTNTWGEANSGGLFGSELKAAGYDAVFLSGISPKPVYLLIDNNGVRLKDATHLWGRDTRETVASLRQETAEKRLRAVCIGPAGESLSLLASVVSDEQRVAGRSGVGAVMGSKKLKAIAVRGTAKIEIADTALFSKMRKETLAQLRDVEHLSFIRMLCGPGTCAGIMLVASGNTPIKNWSLAGGDAFPDYVKLAPDNILKYFLKKAGCGNCPVNCGGILRMTEGQEATETRKPEYETMAAFGPMLFNSDAESIIKANEICDRYGIDTISTGTVIAFAMECYEKGIIGKDDTGGIELNWGDAPAILTLLERIVRREGFGDVLADGVERAAERIGGGAAKHAIHIHGQEPGFHDPRFLPFRGLGYMSNATPGRHMVSMASIRLGAEGKLGSYAELQAPEITDENERAGQINAIATSYSQTFVSSGLCLFALSDGISYPLVEFISAATGWDFSAAEAITAGKRILTLRQAFNIREGLRATDFRLPERLTRPALVGPSAGRSIDFDGLRAAFYEALDWDGKTGVPSRHCLAELGLDALRDWNY